MMAARGFPTLENLIVLTWLRLVHPGLPKLVKQRYGTELKNRSSASTTSSMRHAIVLRAPP